MGKVVNVSPDVAFAPCGKSWDAPTPPALRIAATARARSCDPRISQEAGPATHARRTRELVSRDLRQ
eukprot:5522608-Pyramimonas_sp.AAC.1